MIKSFLNKELAALWNTGKSRIDARMHKRIIVRLSRLHASQTVEEMNVPGFDFHSLHGFSPTRFTVHVNGPWCITFVFENGDAFQVDYEQYH